MAQEADRLRPAGTVNVICQINEATIFFTLFSHPSQMFAIVGYLPGLIRLCKQLREHEAGSEGSLEPTEGTWRTNRHPTERAEIFFVGFIYISIRKLSMGTVTRW